MLHIVLLSGGSGSRLWPLSNEARSKQFLKVLRNSKHKPQSMVQRTFEKIRNLDVDSNIVIATCASQVASIEAQVDGLYDIVVEPERRDTAPAIMLAAAFLKYQQNGADDDTVIVMPIDTYAQQDYYDRILDIDETVQSGQSDLVLLGVEPTYPSAKYGYIVPVSGTSTVEKFVEKPEEAAAAELIKRGALWNCGVFGFKLRFLIDVLSGYCQETTFEGVRGAFTTLPKNSFDYEVVEKADSISVLPFSGAWKDLGTWNTLTEEMEETCSGRVVYDEMCENTHVVNETGLPMVVAGLHDAVVVATPDGILVSDKERSANIKSLVAKAAETRPMYESRQWGEYIVLGQNSFSSSNKSLEKMLIVNAGKQLSYQRHQKRTEVWTIVEGEGEVVLDDEVQPVSTGSVIVIPVRRKHAVRALTRLHIIEVQIGSELIEEDIERFGFFWDNE